ncbi:AAA family ATPase [Pasteurella multocida]|uniref:AAA family ATPase n=1 Tax=Pasteurella multocida TaxID=747 RepID=UPI002C2C0697|nr:AAA family ATPase [Pasteurella multocida]MEB3504329.1 AAA family ATPase [Pasteurella multocida]
MTEHLIIKEFCGINEANIQVNKINVFIGRQSSGKSVTAKLIYFFKEFIQLLANDVTQNSNLKELSDSVLKRFESYFPKTCWQEKTILTYFFSKDFSISLSFENIPIITYSDAFDLEINKLFKKKNEISRENELIQDDELLTSTPLFLNRRTARLLRHDFFKLLRNLKINVPDNQIFIPAGRSFFSIFRRNLMSMLGASENLDLDRFLLRFGTLYDRLRIPETLFGNNYQIQQDYKDIIFKILSAEHFVEDDIDYLVHSDGRKVNIINASSGQQETLPLLVILKAILAEHSYLYSGEKSLYIEEPEAHLYPESQLEIIKLLLILGSKDDNQVFITTHSPYVLSYINNFLLSLKIKGKEKLCINDFSVYFFNRKSVDFIVDYESELILASEFDSVSENISDEFSSLINEIYE